VSLAWHFLPYRYVYFLLVAKKHINFHLNSRNIPFISRPTLVVSFHLDSMQSECHAFMQLGHHWSFDQDQTVQKTCKFFVFTSEVPSLKFGLSNLDSIIIDVLTACNPNPFI
jgi:hypothetical protein